MTERVVSTVRAYSSVAVSCVAVVMSADASDPLPVRTIKGEKKSKEE